MIPTICSGLCTFLTVRSENRLKKKNNHDKAMMLLLREQLRYSHERFIHRGNISGEDLGEFEEMYEVYHALGGNGVGTVWKNDLEKLERSNENGYY